MTRLRRLRDSRHLRGALLALGLGLAVGAGVAFASGGGSGGYRVRAVFDNASFVIPGEDVKVAGVKAGVIDSLDLTPQHKAVVVLRITDPAFAPFHADAHCSIDVQSLIGEQFVECQPTQPRGDGVPPARELPVIRSGPGKGEHLLPVTKTSSPVGIDLLNDIVRLPEQQRLRLIINEFGAGLAGNGQELRAAIRRANPALQQTGRVIGVLASQDRLLGRLVDDSDRVLGPLARQREHVGGAVQHAGEVALATAARGDDLQRDFQKLPAFLRQLRPAADRFSALAGQLTPALESLHRQARAINQTVAGLGPFSAAATPALVTLGKVADRGRRVFPAIQPLATQLGALGKPLNPLARNLAAVSGSFDQAGGIEAVMRFIYFYTGAVNGEDALGHYVRSVADLGACSARMSSGIGSCASNFDKSQGAAAQAASGQAALLDYLLGPGGGR